MARTPGHVCGRDRDLVSDGSNWFKISGKTLPMAGLITLASGTPTTAQSIAAASVTPIQLNTVASTTRA